MAFKPFDVGWGADVRGEVISLTSKGYLYISRLVAEKYQLPEECFVRPYFDEERGFVGLEIVEERGDIGGYHLRVSSGHRIVRLVSFVDFLEDHGVQFPIRTTQHGIEKQGDVELLTFPVAVAKGD